METTPKKAQRCQLTDRGSSTKCVTSKHNKESNKDQSLIQNENIDAGEVSLFGSTSGVVVGALMKECDRVCVPAYCPSVAHKVPFVLSLIYDLPGISKPSGTGVVYFFSGPLNMSEGACQEIIAGPKTVQVMNIRQPGSVELVPFFTSHKCYSCFWLYKSGKKILPVHSQVAF